MAIISAMQLQEFLALPGNTQQSLATSLGVTQSLVHQWVSGKTRITGERARDIEAATGGQVRRHDLRPDLFERQAA